METSRWGSIVTPACLSTTLQSMANHKRRRPKNRRAGCLLCKPHKANHAEMKFRDLASVRRRTQDDPRELVYA